MRRNQTDQYALSYPTQQVDGVDSFGTWPVLYEVSRLLVCAPTIVQQIPSSSAWKGLPVAGRALPCWLQSCPVPVPERSHASSPGYSYKPDGLAGLWLLCRPPRRSEIHEI